MTFTEVVSRTSEAFEALAALVLAVGLVWAAVLSVRVWRQYGDGRRCYATLRESLGGVLVLALEVLVAADLIRTVAVAPTLTNVAVLGLIVLIRTFLSFSLQLEIEGALPWRRVAVRGAAIAARAASQQQSAPAPRERPVSADKPGVDETG
jgi:uncharacterized membrane protein